MGMEQTVSFPVSVPAWSAAAGLLARCGFPVQLRMIDGQLAFPDELPPDDWRELRVGTPGGMVTLRRQEGAVVCVTWGNADLAMRQAWNALAWACAEAGGAQVQTAARPLDAAAFRATAELPPALVAAGG